MVKKVLVFVSNISAKHDSPSRFSYDEQQNRFLIDFGHIHPYYYVNHVVGQEYELCDWFQIKQRPLFDFSVFEYEENKSVLATMWNTFNLIDYQPIMESQCPEWRELVERHNKTNNRRDKDVVVNTFEHTNKELVNDVDKLVHKICCSINNVCDSINDIEKTLRNSEMMFVSNKRSRYHNDDSD